MITFQFDQCFNDKKLARDCEAQGLSKVWCFPRRLIDREDPDVLTDLMGKPNPFVTLDLRMAEEHTASIPERNPGLIVISHGKGANPRTMTTSVARQILGHFKGLFPRWHELLLNNSIVEISRIGVEVWHVEGGRLARDGYLAFSEPDWSQRFDELLRQNVQRGSALPPPESAS